MSALEAAQIGARLLGWVLVIFGAVAWFTWLIEGD